METNWHQTHLTRQCTGTNRQGKRCERNAIPGGTVCVMHGGATQEAQRAAKLNLLGMVEPIIEAFDEIVTTWRAVRCPTCNNPTGDPGPVIRIGQLVLDRSGFHPTLTVEQVAPVNQFDSLSEDELIEQLESMLASAKASRDHKRAHALPAAMDGMLLDAFVVPEDEPPIQDEGQRMPVGNDTPPEGKEEK